MCEGCEPKPQYHQRATGTTWKLPTEKIITPTKIQVEETKLLPLAGLQNFLRNT